jgi:hypothetical protein
VTDYYIVAANCCIASPQQVFTPYQIGLALPRADTTSLALPRVCASVDTIWQQSLIDQQESLGLLKQQI